MRDGELCMYIIGLHLLEHTGQQHRFPNILIDLGITSVLRSMTVNLLNFSVKKKFQIASKHTYILMLQIQFYNFEFPTGSTNLTHADALHTENSKQKMS